VDTIVNPGYSTPSKQEGDGPGRGSGKSPARSGPANRTGRRSGFPPAGGNLYSRPGAFPFAQNGQTSQDGLSQAGLSGYGFPPDATQQQGAQQPWRQGPVDRQGQRSPHSIASTSRCRSSKGTFIVTPKKDQAQGPSSITPPSQTSLPKEGGGTQDLPLSPPHSPVYSDEGEHDMKGQEDATESDSGARQTTPVVCGRHTPHNHAQPGSALSPHVVMRAQDMVSTESTPTVVSRTFEIIFIE
jgi:hypothetical protein